MQTTGICCYWTSFFKLDFSDTDGPPQTPSTQGSPYLVIDILDHIHRGNFGKFKKLVWSYLISFKLSG